MPATTPATLLEESVPKETGADANQARGSVNLVDTTEVEVVGTPGAGRALMLRVVVTNAHASVGTKVTLKEDTTELMTGFAGSDGGGFVFECQLKTNAALRAVAETTGSDVEVSAIGHIK